MRRAMVSRTEEKIEAIEETTSGSRNVFAYLGNADAEERQKTLRPAHAINGLIARRRLIQVTAADRVGIGSPKASALAEQKLDGLVELLVTLDHGIEIVMRSKSSLRLAGRISVAAAGGR
jgi:predicted XRE-type DNA-binding protein